MKNKGSKIIMVCASSPSSFRSKKMKPIILDEIDLPPGMTEKEYSELLSSKPIPERTKRGRPILCNVITEIKRLEDFFSKWWR